MRRMLVPIAVVAFASFLLTKTNSKVWAASPQRTAQEGKGCSAPKEWGQLKGVADRSVAFEDSSGKIRVLDLGPCMRGETQFIVTIDRP